MTGYFRVDHLCVHQIGFTPGLRAADYNKKIKECAQKLADLEQIALPSGELKALCERRSKGKYEIRFHKGPKMGLETRPQIHSETNNSLNEAAFFYEGVMSRRHPPN